MKTYLNLVHDRAFLDTTLNQINSLIRSIPYYFMIEKAYLEFFSQEIVDENISQADFLVNQMQQRDWPMTENEIIEVFKRSGFKYEHKHIQSSRPDTEEYVMSYRKEDTNELHL